MKIHRKKKCTPKPPSLKTTDKPHSVCYLNFSPGKKGKGLAQQHLYAAFANAVYKKNPMDYLLTSGVKGTSGWVLDKRKSNKNTATFVNVPQAKIIMAFRGTDWTNIGDIFRIWVH